MNKGREKLCPKCEADITDTWDEDSRSWYCDECEYPVGDDDDDNEAA